MSSQIIIGRVAFGALILQRVVPLVARQYHDLTECRVVVVYANSNYFL